MTDSKKPDVYDRAGALVILFLLVSFMGLGFYGFFYPAAPVATPKQTLHDYLHDDEHALRLWYERQKAKEEADYAAYKRSH